MSTEYARGKLSFDLMPLLERMNLDEKRGIAEAIACETDVITFVAQQIIDGWTEGCSHGYRGDGSSENLTGLDKAWRDVAKASGDVAKREIERLEAALARERESHRKTVAELVSLRRSLSGSSTY